MYKILKPLVHIPGSYTGWGGYRWSKAGYLDWLTVVYVSGEISFPKLTGSKLFVFDTIRNAEKFLREMIPLEDEEEMREVGDFTYELWQVECGPVETARVMALYCSTYNVETFWQNFPEGVQITRDVPEGTYWTDWLKPVERVYTEIFTK